MARIVPLAMAIIALVLAPLLLCCGAAVAAEPVPAAASDCGHAEPTPTDHETACEGCDDCAPPALSAATKSADPIPALASPAEPVLRRIASSEMPKAFWPPGRAPPGPTPARLHDKLTV